MLVERHSRSLYRLAFRMTGRAEDAEDIVQETFIKAYKQLSRFEARANVSTWLYRIAFNCSVDFLRARPKRQMVADDHVLEGLVASPNAPSMDDLVYAGQIGEQLQLALGGLSGQERAAVPTTPAAVCCCAATTNAPSGDSARSSHRRRPGSTPRCTTRPTRCIGSAAAAMPRRRCQHSRRTTRRTPI
ncbi:MAG: RNA polymerase sigma factor [Acidobacteria bacterium]|nr:RNA polymerase sigma factor [Acidobacteriota bacterium]